MGNRGSDFTMTNLGINRQKPSKQHIWLYLIMAIIQGLFVAGFFNIIWEFIGPEGKVPFVVITGSFILLQIFLFIVIRKFKKKITRTIVYIALVVASFVSAVSITHLACFLVKHSNDEYYFRCRVEAMLNRNYKMFTSTYMPEGLYGSLKKFFGRPWYPQLKDYDHRYDSISIDFYHLNHLGIYSYTYYFDSYEVSSHPNDSLWYFSSLAEGDITSVFKRISVKSPPDTSECCQRITPVFRSKDAFVAVGAAKIPENIHCIRRSFCAPNSMISDPDGFLIDLRSLAHPPKILTIRLTTNQVINDCRIAKVDCESSASLLNWIKAEPFCNFVDPIDLQAESDSDTIDSLFAEIKSGNQTYKGFNKSPLFSPDSVSKWRISSYRIRYNLCGGENLLIVRYGVDRSKCPVCQAERKKSSS